MSYRIVVRGTLSDRFLRAFPDAVAQAEVGATSLLTAAFDQSQLSGFLQRLSSFGLELVSVTQHAGSDEAGVGPAADESPRVDRRRGDDGSPRPDPS